MVWALAAGGTLEDRPRYNKTRCFETFPFPAPDGPEKERIRQLAEELDAHRKARQALHPGLTMTGMYNVLDRLRRGEPLGPKDKAIHEQGLVSVLRELHDDLDAAVLAAYGWEDLTDSLSSGSGATLGTAPASPACPPSLAAIAATGRLPETSLEDAASPRGGAPTTPAQTSAPHAGVDETILYRLVALNAERAAEERRGLVRWLRPDFQNPGGTGAVQGEAEILALPPDAAGPKPDWPKTLPEQFQSLRSALATRPGPVGAADLAKGFARAPRAKVAELLETLASLGHARRLDDGRYLPG